MCDGGRRGEGEGGRLKGGMHWGWGGLCRKGCEHACSATSSQASRVRKMGRDLWQGDGGSRAERHQMARSMGRGRRGKRQRGGGYCKGLRRRLVAMRQTNQVINQLSETGMSQLPATACKQAAYQMAHQTSTISVCICGSFSWWQWGIRCHPCPIPFPTFVSHPSP